MVRISSFILYEREKKWRNGVLIVLFCFPYQLCSVQMEDRSLNCFLTILVRMQVSFLEVRVLAAAINIHNLIHDISQWKSWAREHIKKKEKIKDCKSHRKVTSKKRVHESKPHTNCNHAYIASGKVYWYWNPKAQGIKFNLTQIGINKGDMLDDTGKNSIYHAPTCSSDPQTD